MSTDLLRVEANERLDYTDFAYLLDESMTAAMRDLGENFLFDPNAPAADRVRIIDGFGMTNPSAKQLTVTLGRALLAERVAGVVQYGALVATGDASQTIDMAPLASNTYGVFIRFDYVDAETSSRVFWNPTGDGAEYSQSIPTRRVARWSMRTELASPGVEWLQIGTADNSGGSLVLVDQRNLYFEGSIPDSYESGWSAEGGGIANDRNVNRHQYGVKDLHTFTQAMRQCIADIRGRGLREWYEKGIGGINVGFDSDPAEGRVCVGDANFRLDWVNADDVRLYGDVSDYLQYDRDEGTYGAWKFYVNSNEEVRVTPSGLAVTNGLYVGSISGTPTDNDIYAEQDISCGGDVYADGGVYAGTIGLDATDKIVWTDNTQASHYVNNTEEMRVVPEGVMVYNGLHVGSWATPADNEIKAQGNITSLDYVYAQSGFRFVGGNEYIFNLDNVYMEFVVNSNSEMRLKAAGLAIENGLYVGDMDGSPVNKEIHAEGDISTDGDMDCTQDMTAGTITMSGFSVDADGDVVCKSLDAGSGTIDTTGDLTVGSITMTGFSVDGSGNCAVATMDVTGNCEAGDYAATASKILTTYMVDASVMNFGAGTPTNVDYGDEVDLFLDFHDTGNTTVAKKMLSLPASCTITAARIQLRGSGTHSVRVTLYKKSRTAALEVAGTVIGTYDSASVDLTTSSYKTISITSGAVAENDAVQVCVYNRSNVSLEVGCVEVTATMDDVTAVTL